MRLTLFYVSIFFLIFPSSSMSQEWNKWDDGNHFWVKQNATFSSENGAREFGYSAFRFERTEYVYELLEMTELFQSAYPEITPDNIVFDEVEDASRVIRPSMAEAWRLLNRDKSIVAVVPFGFAEVAGESSIVGFRKEGEAIKNGIFSAPNLDSILCLDDTNAHTKRLSAGKPIYPGQIPFLLPIVFEQRVNYKYFEDLRSVAVGTRYDPNRFVETFGECQDMIQVGYRIIAPRDVKIDDDSEGRISHGPGSLKKVRAFDRVVMAYDRFGYLNFMRSDGPSHVHDVGTLLSSDAYYDDQPCRYSENRSYGKRSLSCELWAVTVSAFDGAAVYLRKPDEEPIVWGDSDRTTPAVLVIRERALLPLTTGNSSENLIKNDDQNPPK